MRQANPRAAPGLAFSRMHSRTQLVRRLTVVLCASLGLFMAACGSSKTVAATTTTTRAATAHASTVPTTAPPTTAPPTTTYVHAGAYCSPDGATGVTASGTAMICKTSPTDSRDRWRSQ